MDGPGNESGDKSGDAPVHVSGEAVGGESRRRRARCRARRGARLG